MPLIHAIAFFLAILIASTEAIGADDAPPPCLDLSSWGSFGTTVATVLTVLAVLRPVSQALLAASTIIGPGANALARALYWLGQASAMICIAKPKFSDKFQPPPPPTRDGSNEMHGG